MTPTLKDALDGAVEAIKNMSPEELRKKLDENSDGIFSQMHRDMEGFSQFLQETGAESLNANHLEEEKG